MAIDQFIEKDSSGNPIQIHYELTGGMKFSLKHLEGVDCEPASYFGLALDKLDEAANHARAISADRLLSEAGKQHKMAPICTDLIGMISGAWFMLDQFEQRIVAREKALVKLPTIDPSHWAAATEDVEIRSWWRSQPLPDRLRILESFESDPGSERIQMALLRSPIALVDVEAKRVREIWTGTQRAKNPEEAAFIDIGKASIDWAQGGLANLAGLSRILMKMPGQEILKTIVSHPSEGRQRGYKAFGFSDHSASEMKRYLEIKAGQKAA